MRLALHDLEPQDYASATSFNDCFELNIVGWF